MKKRCFTRYDTNMSAQYRTDGSDRWQPCTVNKLSRKGLGVALPTKEAPVLGSLLYVNLATARASECLNLRGTVKWIECADNGYTGGIELCEIVNELEWLQLIYFIRHPLEKKSVIDIKTIHEQSALQNRAPLPIPPPKVVVPTALEQIKSILNYKIL